MITKHDQYLLAATPELPDDLAEAFEGMKLAILRHRCDGWREVSRRDIEQVFEILRALSLPSK